MGDDGEGGEATMQPTCQCMAMQSSACRKVRDGMGRPEVMMGAVLGGGGGTQYLTALTGPAHTYHLSRHKHHLSFRRFQLLGFLDMLLRTTPHCTARLYCTAAVDYRALHCTAPHFTTLH